MQYCHIKDGVIDEQPQNLPDKYPGVGGLNKFDDAQLKALGWLPVNDVKPDIDTYTERLGSPSYTIETDVVTISYPIITLSQEDTDSIVQNKKNILLLLIKEEAKNRIFTKYPMSKQNNISAKNQELDAIISGNKINASTGEFETARPLTDTEKIEKHGIALAWEWVQMIRGKSNDLESSIAGMTSGQLESLDVTDNSHWA